MSKLPEGHVWVLAELIRKPIMQVKCSCGNVIKADMRGRLMKRIKEHEKVCRWRYREIKK